MTGRLRSFKEHAGPLGSLGTMPGLAWLYNICMETKPLQKEHIDDAAALFAANFQRLRRAVPALPERMANPAVTRDLLDALVSSYIDPAVAGAAVFEGGRLAGYLGWWMIDGFRDTPRRAGYVPVWASAACEGSEDRVLRALYREAARTWYEAGCKTHAITLLADDPAIHSFWFWNGFGLTVVDAIHPAEPLGLPAPTGIAVRAAAVDDAPLVAALEAEHWQHYQQPPVLMLVNGAEGVENLAALIADPANRVWLAYCDGELAGYLRLEGSSFGAAEVVQSPATLAITGAYTRPAMRGRGAAPALLDAALADAARQAYRRCSVDFESINPEASAFWRKYFTPVCYSVFRVPEREK